MLSVYAWRLSAVNLYSVHYKSSGHELHGVTVTGKLDIAFHGARVIAVVII